MSDAIQMIVMPKWGLAMQEGMVAQWHVAEGAKITKGQEIVDIETSKIANVFESPISGTLRRLVVKDGETVPVAYLIGVVAEAAVTDAEVDAFVEDFKANFVFDAAGAGGPEPEDATTAAGRIRFLEMGDGEGAPIVFIHGYGGDLNNWMFNQEELSAGHKTYAIDLPGHGGSTKEWAMRAARPRRCRVAFMDSKDIKKAHLVGHSMGGATRSCWRSSSRIGWRAPRWWRPQRSATRSTWTTSTASSRRSGRRNSGPCWRCWSATRPDLQDMVEDVLKFKRLDGVDAALKKLRDALMPGGKQAGSLRDGLAGLKVPVQILWGEVDQVLPVGHSEGLPASIKVTRFAGVGHMPHMEKAAETNELIRALAG